ncbi:Acetyl-CoA synthetase (ADP-forming) alpha and beta chains, putative [Sphingobium indicum BiD32]|uniref:Acetyl-CoA synthetase (ADP-forming) alpha and beta chains, putative n=1 Tax=Sphingobium indicum BiD32 TaxID=1301087 RepID=N1MLX0_9SPHN|nr:acetate--CoA ligase family protein [Sphingobium indicum]CCW16488.1 Acetyl-CoA synthetase (ADP-forming) alpha and beta chains, putative [Sphingobium indicum BiD32]
MNHNLHIFFQPRSVVLVGATDKSAWSQLIHGNFGAMGYDGQVWLVNKRGTPAHGRAAVTSCRDLPAVPDIAYIFVPTDAVREALEDVAEAGIRHALILSSGYAEAGPDGTQKQDGLIAYARDKGVTLLGPNSLGFINYVHDIPVSPFPVGKEYLRGHLAIVSQSGATTNVIANFAQQQGIGLSYAIATGNEADLDTARVIDYLAQDEATRVIAVFAETIKDPAAFRTAARKAAAAGKPLIILKVGRTELASQLAQAHTGSVTGDDRIFDAVCAQDNIIRVTSIEELVVTAGVLAHTGPIEGGVAIISISGGACEVIADTADLAGLALPPFAEATRATLQAVIADYGAIFNPLDVTGAAVRDPSLFERILTILAADPAIGLTACVYDLPRDGGDFVDRTALTCIGAGLAASKTPGIMINQAIRPVSAFSRNLMAELGIPAVTGGLDLAVRALAAAQRWSERRVRKGKADTGLSRQAAITSARPASEYETLIYLQGQGAPVIQVERAPTADEAVEAWRAIGGPVVLKIASSAIQHKSDIGGVRLNLDSEVAIRDAFAAIMTAARAAYPDAPIDGCLVAPMRPVGIELFVGIAQSPWGPVIVAGLGGVWIELLADTSLRLLPIDETEARAMLDELRARRILDGYRGAPAADLGAVAEAMCKIGNAALALGPDLVTLEINPLLARGDEVEALDALAVWRDG